MPADYPYAILIAIGAVAGLLSGFMGVGGGIIIVPALVYFLGFSQHKATGTSLAILLPPIGLGAVLEFHRKGNVDLRAGIVVAITMIAGAWLGAHFAQRLSGPVLKLAFGVFLMVMGGMTIYKSVRAL